MNINPEHLKKTLDEHAIVSLTDVAGNIIYANQEFTRIAGYTLSEILGKNHRILKSGIHPPSFYQEMWDTLMEGKTWHGKICNRRKNGEHYWVNASIKPILDENQLPVQYLSIRTDVTEIEYAREKLGEINARLEVYRQASENEFDMARDLMEHMIKQASAQLANVVLWSQPATTLSGDLILVQNYNNERTYLLLADAMGHGLPAVLPLMPVAHVFAAMSRKGLSVSTILDEMNAKMTDCLPVGNFVAMTLLSLDHKNKLIEIWNGGNPPGLLIDGTGAVIQKFKSCHPSIGILRGGEFDSSPELFYWQGECSLTLYSDGLSEAKNSDGVEFGEVRIIDALRRNPPHQSLKDAILAHIEGLDASDDISTTSIMLHG